MKLVSVNIGQEHEIQNAKDSGKTGIYKLPTEQPARVTRLGLENDVIVDSEHHGGEDQAVYVYGSDDYDWWSQTLEKELEPGTFGENLTIEGLESARFQVGDRLEIGPVVLEVTAPRIPCVTLATRMQDPLFVKRFRQAERPGLYCRVIAEGDLQAGLPVLYRPYQGPTVSVIEMFRNFYEPDKREATVRRYLNAPIAIRDRVEKEALLQKIMVEKQ